YQCDVDISDLITLEDVIREIGLGPNGGLIYCLEYLEKNIDWLLSRLEPLRDRYIIFDCPGQVELYTHHNSVKNILETLQKNGFRLCVVHTVDAHLCTDANKYIAALLLSLKTMIQLEFPHINVLSKMDLIQSYGKLTFNIDYYTEVQDLSYLLASLNEDSTSFKKLGKLNRALCELIEEFSLVGFHTLAVNDRESMLHLCQVIDKATGYIYGSLDSEDQSILETVAASTKYYFQELEDLTEKYVVEKFDEGE
ncbi:GPN-loop GTPase 2, partial [Blyttiomyces sp. JEL0837]